jgi:HTH-type transcriptional repressor of NAD biosynthesis genes
MTKNVSQNLVKKVVFMGAPSTGKTTLVLACASHFSTQYVLEYGREYWEKNNIERQLTPAQLLYIAQEQIRQEDAAVEHCNKYLFVDTNALTTWHFAQDYHGSALPELSALADQSKDRFDHVFLCGDEIPYEDTPERSGDVKRHVFQAFITQQLQARGIQYTYLNGSVEARLQTIIDTLTPDAN